MAVIRRKRLTDGLAERQFKKLLMWTTKCTTLNFDGRFSEQIHGVGMDSLITPAFAHIFMNYMIKKRKLSTTGRIFSL